MESITMNKNYPTSQKPISGSNDEDDLMRLFDQFTGFMPSMSDQLEPDTTTVISEASLLGKSATHQVTIKNLTTMMLPICTSKTKVI